MIRTFIFWLIVAPSSLGFILGLLANVCQTMANKGDKKKKNGEDTSQLDS